MNRKTKAHMISGAVMIITGILLFVFAMTVNGWDFKKLSTVKFETNTYEIVGKFKNIEISAMTADIVFVPSVDGEAKAVVYEAENMKHTVSKAEDTLRIVINDERVWRDLAAVSFDMPKITVSIPEGNYGFLKIKNTTGDIVIDKAFTFSDADIELSTGDVYVYSSVAQSVNINLTTGDIRMGNMSAGRIDLENTTGDTKIENLNCGELHSKGTTGDFTLKNTTVSGKITVRRNTGDVEFFALDAAEIYVKTTTGDVKGTLKSEMIVDAESNTGSISVPKTENGGKCEIRTGTGKIEIGIQK